MYHDEIQAAAKAQVMNSGASLGIGGYRPPTPRQKLLKQQEELSVIQARIANALAVLDANPGMEEFLDVTQGLI